MLYVAEVPFEGALTRRILRFGMCFVELFLKLGLETRRLTYLLRCCFKVVIL